MRTTITLDPDVAARIERIRKRDRRPFKAIVNDLLRAGLAGTERDENRPAGPFTRPARLGAFKLASLDDVSEALALAEGDDHR